MPLPTPPSAMSASDAFDPVSSMLHLGKIGMRMLTFHTVGGRETMRKTVESAG